MFLYSVIVPVVPFALSKRVGVAEDDGTVFLSFYFLLCRLVFLSSREPWIPPPFGILLSPSHFNWKTL